MSLTKRWPFWKRVALGSLPECCSPEPCHVQRLQFWAFVLGALPLSLFILFLAAMPQPSPTLTRINSADLWIEPLGQAEFLTPYLQTAVAQPPHLAQAHWQPVTLPNSIELPEYTDLPAKAPVARAWFRIHLPPEWRNPPDPSAQSIHGGLGLMGNRIMGGPWAVWVNGQLVQTNLANWRASWNVPLRIPLPPTQATAAAPDIFIAIIHQPDNGYAMGSLFVGQMSAIDQAWTQRNFLYAGISYAAGLIALALALTSFQLMRGHPREPMYFLLFANAVIWLASGFQYTNDVANDGLAVWLSWAEDASINWIIVYTFLFAFTFEKLALPRLRTALLLYAAVITLVSMPAWGWEKQALLFQHNINLLIYLGCSVFLSWQAWRKPRREIFLICTSNWLLFAFGAHDLYTLTNQAHPDQFHLMQIGVILSFIVFMYVTNRHYIQILNDAERHEVDLQRLLAAQALQLEKQHTDLRQMEVMQKLQQQQKGFVQDLHDRVGSLLTSGVYMVRSGQASKDEMLHLLASLSEEVRTLSAFPSPHPANGPTTTLGDELAYWRTRTQPQIDHSPIALHWDVATDLPEDLPLTLAAAREIQAMLAEMWANTLKHARATQFKVSAWATATHATIQISDNGVGFDPDHPPRQGLGLTGMQQRATAIGATLTLQQTDHGQGCTWRLEMLLEADPNTTN